MTTPAAAARARVSRETVLNQPRSGAKPLGNSPGAGPGRQARPSSAGPASSKPTKQPGSGASAPAGAGGSAGPQPGPSPTSSAPRSRSAGSSKGKGKGSVFGSFGRAQAAPSYHNYQAIILAEFVAAEILVAATPMATRENQPGISPYVSRDLVQLMAIGLVYFVLEMVAVGGRGAGRISAWLGALILLTVGLSEAASIAKVFAFITGGSGKPSVHTTAAAAAPPTGIQAYLAAAPTIGATQEQAGAPGGGSGGSGPHSGSAFVSEAAKFLGKPYVFGAAGPGAFDCSGLVKYSLEKMGLAGVPRTSEEQWGWVQRISQGELAAGDLIFEQWPGEASPGHVAIYAGNGSIIQAPAPGEDVQRVKWSPSIVHAEGGQIVGYGRVPGLSYGSATAGEASGGKLK